MGLLMPPPVSRKLIRGLNRRLVLPNRLHVQTVMASPPVTSLTTSHTIASPRLKPATANTGGANNTTRVDLSSISVSGAGSIIAGASFPNTSYVTASSVSYAGGNSSFNAVSYSIMHRGSAIEVWLKGDAGFTRVKIDDQYISLTAFQTTNDGSSYFYYINFGSTATRRVEVMTTSRFGGFYMADTDTISPAPMRGPRFIVMGDSFVEGTQAQGLATTDWVKAFADTMGWDDVWWSGVGATGYLATNSGARYNYRQRCVADLIAFNPDGIAFTGGINDTSFSQAEIQAEAIALYSQVQAGLPNTQLIAVSPLAATGVSGHTLGFLGVVAGVKAAAAALGIPYVDVLELPLTSSQQTAHTMVLQGSISALATTLTVDVIPNPQATYRFEDNGTKFQCKSFSGSTNPFTITTDGAIQTAHTAGCVITQVGDCYITGRGNTSSPTGYGNADKVVSGDSTHPAQDGHEMQGSTVAARMIDILDGVI